MSDTFAQFEERLNHLERKHRELARGYVAKIDPDGLITVEPKQRRGAIRLRVLSALFLGFLLFKVVMMITVGPETYDSRLDELRVGTGPEQISAWVMQADPLSAAVADYIISAMP